MKQLAIIGPTASGKSDLAIDIARKIDAYILSIDSLSIYKEIDIVAAKPSKEELALVKHFGINYLNPDQYFSAELLIQLYKDVVNLCKKNNKNLIIVGGTSFYLKSLLDGLSPLPQTDETTLQKVSLQLKELSSTYDFLYSIDKEYMEKISHNDRYRIEKALIIYESSAQTPTQWFKQNPPQPVIASLEVFNIDVERDVLRKRIGLRTHKMIEMGVIDEVAYLEAKYGRAIHPMSSIGIVEVLEYLDGKISLENMRELISIHTAQLAKRQQTFNKTQFKEIISSPLDELQEIILKRII
ncbi:MAG: tRNA (adenosine(37)-N6)-dimethylallyltransferase MiaA [Campylobacterales bacterium]|nr:tRNA (adenosine(37)-N6)-dimethylallyltransferase MiaA [Campylobacterales bacterium]